MKQRTRNVADSDMTHRFDMGDAGDFADGPTILPGPWSPPPDPEFRTGTVLRIERADLRVGIAPGVEPADSVQQTVRFSREEMRELVAPRPRPARPARPAPAPQETAALPLRLIPREAGTAPTRTAGRWLPWGWLALQLALAFVAGVLTGVIAVR